MAEGFIKRRIRCSAEHIIKATIDIRSVDCLDSQRQVTMANMSKQECFVKIAAILSALLETNGSPESMLYIFCDMNMDNWQMLRHILVEAKLVTIKGNFVMLTEDGRIKAEKLNALVAAKAS